MSDWFWVALAFYGIRVIADGKDMARIPRFDTLRNEQPIAGPAALLLTALLWPVIDTFMLLRGNRD